MFEFITVSDNVVHETYIHPAVVRVLEMASYTHVVQARNAYESATTRADKDAYWDAYERAYAFHREMEEEREQAYTLQAALWGEEPWVVRVMLRKEF